MTSPLVAGETFTYQISVSAGRHRHREPGAPAELRRRGRRRHRHAARRSRPGRGDVVAGVVHRVRPGRAGATSGPSSRRSTSSARCHRRWSRSPAPSRPGSPGRGRRTRRRRRRRRRSLGADAAGPRRRSRRRSNAAPTSPSPRSPTAPRRRPGGGITFTVTVTNTGPSDATNVVLTDLLPAPLVFSADGSDDECAPSSAATSTCALGTVTAGSSRALTIAATVPPDAAPGDVVNTASVTSDVDDPDGTDDTRIGPRGGDPGRRPRCHQDARRRGRAARRHRSPTPSRSSTRGRPTRPAWCSRSRSRPARRSPRCRLAARAPAR